VQRNANFFIFKKIIIKKVFNFDNSPREVCVCVVEKKKNTKVEKKWLHFVAQAEISFRFSAFFSSSFCHCISGSDFYEAAGCLERILKSGWKLRGKWMEKCGSGAGKRSRRRVCEAHNCLCQEACDVLAASKRRNF